MTVPDEIGVLGCDNDPTVCHYTPVPLSSINIDWDRIGYVAAQLLDRMMDGEVEPPEPVLIPSQGVVARMSTNILAVPDARIARALRFIWERFPEPISSGDVAQEAGINRRTLELGFSKYLNRSVCHEITRVRIELAKVLLAKPELKAHEIAEQCGFSSVLTFSEAFLRVVGMRPSNYRKIDCTTKADAR